MKAYTVRLTVQFLSSICMVCEFEGTVSLFTGLLVSELFCLRWCKWSLFKERCSIVLG